MEMVGINMSVAMRMIAVTGMEGCSERPEREPVGNQYILAAAAVLLLKEKVV